jgi:hypothetical protein
MKTGTGLQIRAGFFFVVGGGFLFFVLGITSRALGRLAYTISPQGSI